MLNANILNILCLQDPDFHLSFQYEGQRYIYHK